MPLRTTIEPAASLPKQISGTASCNTPGVCREWLLVVCAQALFACLSLHNGRLNQTAYTDHVLQIIFFLPQV